MPLNKKQSYRIALLPGDGIGKEVMPPAVDVLETVGRRFGFEFKWTEFDWGCERLLRTGSMMPADGLAQLRDFDAILLGAVGWPGVPDHVSLWGLLVPIRREFRQYVNLRPVRLYPGLKSPLVGRRPEDINFVIVRENNEGEYSQIGGRIYQGTDDEVVIQETVFTRRGVDRILTYAFELARSRPRHNLISATKSNGIVHTMPYWDERFAAMAGRYPDIKTAQYHIDILVAHFVMHPDWFDVVVGSNLFADILSDLGPALTGSIGLAPAANINPERDFPSMFEPVHGSAPDIAGKNIANPIAQILSGAMMLDHLGQAEAAAVIDAAVAGLLADEKGPRTRDLGGHAGTDEVGKALALMCADTAVARTKQTVAPGAR